MFKAPDMSDMLAAGVSATRSKKAAMEAILVKLQELYKSGQLRSLEPALPLLLSLKGRPLSLERHFPMSPLFSLDMSQETVVQAGRQISKSTTLAELMIILAGMIEFSQMLYVAPLSEQTRNFSVNYVKPFLTHSPIRSVLLDPSVEQNVFQRSFLNGSIHQYSFAYFDAERIRGKPADFIFRDEYQDLDPSFDPIIDETASASSYKIKFYTGTSKTLDTPLSVKYDKSSQGVWAVKCQSCGSWNLMTTSMGLLDMIQKPGLVCRKCWNTKGKTSLLDPKAYGQWVHAYPERYYDIRGFHTPQMIFPMHYAPDPITGLDTAWKIIYRAKMEQDRVTFLNEKCGEPADFRVSLLTRRDLEAASLLKHPNELAASLRAARNYKYKSIGIDWGGGGEKGVSLTKIAILGGQYAGRLDVLYMEAFTGLADKMDECERILELYKAFGCASLAHDYRGSGDLREMLLIQRGFPQRKIFNVQYVTTAARDMVLYHPPSDTLSRYYWSVDRTRSLVLTCAAIRAGYLRFPRWDTWENTHAKDFLALVENQRETETRGSILTIGRRSDLSDDMAHAVNIAALAYWHSNRAYPDLGKDLFKRYRISEDIEAALRAQERGERDA